ncbi:MAG: hypothetical protein ACYC4U_06600 [Pirellulaceae bacterium]
MNALSLILFLSWIPADRPDPPFLMWPENIGEYVRKSVGSKEQPLGYSPQQMASFPGRAHRLGYVSRMFAAAERVPDETNRLARRMLSSDFDRALNSALALLGSQISLDAEKEKPAADIVPAGAKSKAAWEALPESVREAVTEVVRGAVAAKPYLWEAFDWNAIARQTGDAKVSALGTMQAYQLAAGPWLAYGGGSASFAALSSFKATPLGNGAATLCTSVRPALTQLLAANQAGGIPAFDSLQLKTNAGTVRVLGPGKNTYRGSDAIVIDLGGDDHYSGRLAVPVSKAAPVGLLIDVAGNDTYDGRQSPASIACGLFGIGALFDLGGDDKYLCQDSGLGCAWHGIGLLVDSAGDDTYTGHQWCQGAAHAGVGMLIDEAGNDKYFCQVESQGLGSTLGIGVLIDKAGHDRYHAYDNENGRRITFPSSQTASHETSLAQGCGYGRRADTTDGRSMAGGVGALFDGAGDDSYYGGVFSQATGFWWSVGMLVDLGGNDKYRGVYFAQGASAHFAIGSMIDHAGDDHYNDQRVLGQTLGSARDGAIGTFVDVAGDDVYYIPKKSAGGGDMNSVGLFCDKDGADEYHPLARSYMGTASSSNPRGERFRTAMPTVGVFVDLNGEDHYPPQGNLRNNGKWYHESGSQLWGFGFDTHRK